MHDGVMYLQAPGAVIKARDAVTGQLIWEHKRDIAQNIKGGARAKRIAIGFDMVYWTSPDNYLIALDARTGEGRWEANSKRSSPSPSERSKYLRYHLNVPLKAAEDPVIDMAKWQACGGGLDLRQWPEHDVDSVIHNWGLLDQPCWAGVDASKMESRLFT